MQDVAVQVAVGAAALGVAAAGACAYAYVAPNCRVFLPVVSHGDRASGAVALTFDDGPRVEGTTQILDVLKREGVSAAFFVIGANSEKYPELIRRMDAEGHLVCNHTYDHRPMGALKTRRFWRDQLKRTDAVISSIIGRRPAMFRAPLGHKCAGMRGPVREGGYTPVGWSRRGFDGVATTPEKIVARLAEKAVSGDILVMHDGREPWSSRDPAPTVAALPRVIARLRERGLGFARLDALLGIEGYRG